MPWDRLTEWGMSFVSYDLSISVVALERLNPELCQSEAVETFDFLIRIVDAFTRIVNNFKTALKGFRYKFKRSELKAYHESHVLAINRFLKQRTFDPSLSVPIPSGMKVSYIQAVNTIDPIYTQLDIGSTIDTLLDYFNTVSKSGDFTSTKDITKKISKLRMDQVETTLRTVFTADKTLEVKLGSVIASFDELISVDQHILKYESIFQHVDVFCTKLDKIEATIDVLIKDIEKTASPDRTMIQDLYDLVHTAGVQLDIYGVLLDSFQRIEHNFVILLRRVVDTTRI